ncbi:MAG: 1,4-dihydroxy-2-naphthoate polyprenyltransferase [Dehalococcoidia bacterium]|nr:1,4-dihydroxy-2-naphthoate polyprenyltransferase [Dehalococcoidia bacterium]MCB9491444.1 1,4-dihydroxy-2-naphthoate polyprenyltransferase [Dehalococcoidia bacterium]
MPRAHTLPAPGSFRAWVLAIRPPTLTAAVVPVAVGAGVAIRDGYWAPLAALAALVGALALQIGANFANDLSDFRRGADTEDRLGPPRATQLGLLSQRQVTTGILVSFGLATVAGLYLVYVGGWPIIAIGLASMLAAVTYTGGPWPFGYRGLGELFVFIFFGVVAVAGTYYVQAGEVSGHVIAASIPVALTVTAILVVNNVRDIDTDRVAGKFTLAVYLGRKLARTEFVVVVAGAYLAAASLWLLGDYSGWVLLSWLSVPVAIVPGGAVLARTDGPSLNEALRSTARLHFVFGILLALGVAL